MSSTIVAKSLDIVIGLALFIAFFVAVALIAGAYDPCMGTFHDDRGSYTVYLCPDPD